jgi:hypothetical protein
MSKQRMTRAQLLALPPAVDIVTAGHALGFERTTTYKFNREGKFPVPVLKIGDTFRVPTAPLLRYLGIDPAESVHRDDTQPATSADEATNRRTNSRDDEPVVVTMPSGKKRLIYPNDMYKMKGSDRRLLGSEIIKKHAS